MFGEKLFDIVEVCPRIFKDNRTARGVENLNRVLIDAVKKSGIKNGHVIVQSLHSTAGILVQEDEAGILEHDIPKMLDRIAPPEEEYRHDDFDKRRPRVGPDERVNGKAHIEYVLATRPSAQFIVHDAKIFLGNWVSVLFYDVDPVGRESRQIAIQVVGE